MKPATESKQPPASNIWCSTDEEEKAIWKKIAHTERLKARARKLLRESGLKAEVGKVNTETKQHTAMQTWLYLPLRCATSIIIFFVGVCATIALNCIDNHFDHAMMDSTQAVGEAVMILSAPVLLAAAAFKLLG